MKASLHLEAVERRQWPRLYLLSRPRSCGRTPSLVGDGGQVLRVLGWALTIEYAIYRWCYSVTAKVAVQSRELFSDIRGRGGASNASTHE